MDDHKELMSTELLQQIKKDIDEALYLAELEEYKVKDYRTNTRIEAMARNYINIKTLLKTISKNISTCSDIYIQ